MTKKEKRFFSRGLVIGSITTLMICLILIASCNTTKPTIDPDTPDVTQHVKELGRITKIEPHLDLYGKQTSTIETTNGAIWIYGRPTFKKYYKVQQQQDHVYIIDEQGKSRKYPIVK